MAESYYNSSLTGAEIESALVFADGASKVNGILNVKDAAATAVTLTQEVTEATDAIPSSNAVKTYVDSGVIGEKKLVFNSDGTVTWTNT